MPAQSNPQTRPVEKLQREEAVARLKRFLLLLVDEEHSMCKIAAEKGILCGGFTQYSDRDLKRRYAWLVERDPGMNRTELEESANKWQLARQLVHNLPIACDTQAVERDTCRGWDDFSDQELAHYCHEILGQKIEIVH